MILLAGFLPLWLFSQGCLLGILSSKFYSMGVTAYVVVHNHLTGCKADPTIVDFMDDVTYVPWTRMDTYVFGMLFAIAYYHIKRRYKPEQIKVFLYFLLSENIWKGFLKWYVVFGLYIFSGALMAACVWGQIPLYHSFPSCFGWNDTQAAFFWTLSRPAWCIGLGTIVGSFYFIKLTFISLWLCTLTTDI